MPGFRLLETIMNERGEVELCGPEEKPEQKPMEPVNLFTDIFNGTPKDPLLALREKFKGGFTRREGLFQKLWRKLTNG